MKKAMIVGLAVLVPLVAWILVEANMGTLYRIAYGDLAPPDIPYNGEMVEGYNIVLDEVVRPDQSVWDNKELCGVGCGWILTDTPFNSVYLTLNETEVGIDKVDETVRLASIAQPCVASHFRECITERTVDQIPWLENTLVYREYIVTKRFYFTVFVYRAYELCVGGRIVARYSQTEWVSTTALAEIMRVGYGSLGEDVTGSMINATDQMQQLFERMVKVRTPKEGSGQCRRNSIGVSLSQLST